MKHNTTFTTHKIIKHIHHSIWEKVAEKAICRMPKHQLTQQTNIFFQDQVRLNTNPTIKKEQTMNTPPHTERRPKQNLLVGSTPIRPLEQPEQYEPPVGRRRRAHTVIRPNNTRGMTQELLFIGKRKKKQVIKLKDTTVQPTEEEIALEDRFREEIDEKTMKKQEMEQKEATRRAINQYRSMTEQKKFEEIKDNGFAYDYDGSLIDLQPHEDQKKKPKRESKSVEKVPYMSSASKQHTVLSSRMKRTFTQIKHIAEKTVVEQEVAGDEGHEDPEEEAKRKQQVQTGIRSVLHMWTSRETLQSGVRVTDSNTHQRLEGTRFQRSDKKMMTLSEFKLSACGVESFHGEKDTPQRCKTARQRVKTQPTSTDKNFSWKNRMKIKQVHVTKTEKGKQNRGRIDIINDLLYAEHFPTSFRKT